MAADAVTWQPRSSRLRAGVARRDITPPVGIERCVWGANTTGASTGVHDRLTLTAVYLAPSAGDRGGFVVSVDLRSIGCRICGEDHIRPAIAAELGVEKDDLLIHATHTHAAPRVCIHEKPAAQPDLIPAFQESIIRNCAEACAEARSTASLADITWSYGRCALAANRELQHAGQVLVGFNPAGPADDTVAVGRVATTGGEALAILVNYACHPTTLAWQNTLLSPDFVGAARSIVEDAAGAPMIFLQGASGDLAPRNQYTGDTVVADRNGRALGYSVVAALEAMQPTAQGLGLGQIVQSGAALAVWEPRPCPPRLDLTRRRLDIPVVMKQLSTIGQLGEEWADLSDAVREERLARAARVRRRGYPNIDSAVHPVWLWHIGDAVIIAHPGEAYSYLQTELRRRHPDKIILALNLTNGPGYVYVPAHAAYVKGSYPSWQTVLAPGTLEHIVEVLDAELSGHRQD